MGRYKPSVTQKDEETPDIAPERIQKVLARAGLGSRRKIETAIRAGEVIINGNPAALGSSLSIDDKVSYNQRSYIVIPNSKPQQTLVYNKRLGEITSHSDPEGRRTVFDRLPAPEHGRWIAIGRLDINTSGLLIMTTDGELANAMMHPSSGVDREYACRIHGQVNADQLKALRAGVELDDGMAKFSDISVAGGSDSNQWFQVTIMEGRNREVRRLWATQGVEVSRLQRVRYGAVFLPKGLLRGHWNLLSDKDHRILREDVKLPRLTEELTLQPMRNRQALSTGKKTPTRSKQRTKPTRQQRDPMNKPKKRSIKRSQEAVTGTLGTNKKSRPGSARIKKRR